MAHNDDFCQGLAKVLQGESQKARSYVTHAPSLGLLREKMVRNFIRHDTPEKFRVETGLVRNHDKGISSRQCDLLVHEPTMTAPLYRWEDFVVVDVSAARAVVEVKSDLRDLSDLLQIHESLMELYPEFLPTFGYGLTGATLNSCAEYIRQAVVNNRLKFAEGAKHSNWPACFVIQDRHCVGVCPVFQATTTPVSFCMVDLTKATEDSYAIDGIETGFFLQIYTAVLAQRRQALLDRVVYLWFNDLPIRPEGKLWVRTTGEIGTGNVCP